MLLCYSESFLHYLIFNNLKGNHVWVGCILLYVATVVLLYYCYYQHFLCEICVITGHWGSCFIFRAQFSNCFVTLADDSTRHIWPFGRLVLFMNWNNLNSFCPVLELCFIWAANEEACPLWDLGWHGVCGIGVFKRATEEQEDHDSRNCCCRICRWTCHWGPS